MHKGPMCLSVRRMECEGAVLLESLRVGVGGLRPLQLVFVIVIVLSGQAASYHHLHGWVSQALSGLLVV